MIQRLFERQRGMLRPRAIAAVTLALLLLAACGPAADGSGSPLTPEDTSGGFSSCVQAPNRSTDIETWSTPIGFALDLYYNQSSSALRIESVRLADAHRLVVHQTLAYLMAHDLHPLPYETAWAHIGQGVPAAAWAKRQSVPGAVIKPVDGKPAPGPDAGNVYDLVVDLSATSPQGGWATGEIVRYEVSGQTYTIRSYTGYAVAPPASSKARFCDPQINAIRAAFKADGR